MPGRSQAIIRHHLNRLQAEIDRHAEEHAPLAALQPLVTSTANQLNEAWQHYMSTVDNGDREREERDDAIGQLANWIRSWRPVAIALSPSSEQSLEEVPFRQSSPSNILTLARDLKHFIEEKEALAPIREIAIQDLGTLLEDATRETSEATEALPLEESARHDLTTMSLEANRVLLRGIEVVRVIFGRTSSEYRQFMQRSIERSVDEDVVVGEGADVEEAVVGE